MGYLRNKFIKDRSKLHILNIIMDAIFIVTLVSITISARISFEEGFKHCMDNVNYICFYKFTGGFVNRTIIFNGTLWINENYTIESPYFQDGVYYDPSLMNPKFPKQTNPF
jgi:hypothetical protein